jgi:protease-4
VSKARKIAVDELATVIKKMLIQSPADALQRRLINDTLYFDQVEDEIRKVAGFDDKEKVKYIGLKKYMRYAQTEVNDSKNKIAVIVGEGAITSGQSDEDNIGSETIVEELRKARKDENVKAVVLRINSPGGSALASDVMWREIMLTKKVKPIIASMSSVAASGGYYMAMGCDKIVAHPNTITGSIGIFALLVDAQDFMKDKLGITFDRVKTGEMSDLGMPTKHFSEIEKKVIQKNVEDGYVRFTSKAAQGRKMSLDSLRAVASGRVWAGTDAKRLGLVDELGSLEDAINIAAKSANVSGDYKVKYLPAPKTFIAELLEKSQSRIKENAMREQLGQFYPYFKQLEKIQKIQGIQALMPYEIVIK